MKRFLLGLGLALVASSVFASAGSSFVFLKYTLTIITTKGSGVSVVADGSPCASFPCTDTQIAIAGSAPFHVDVTRGPCGADICGGPLGQDQRFGGSWDCAPDVATATGITTSCDFEITTDGSLTVGYFGAIESIAITLAGSGGGAVSARGRYSGSVPAGFGPFSCSTSCSKTALGDDTLRVNAIPDKFSTFAGWSGNCVGTDFNCLIETSRSNAVTAKFTLESFQLAIGFSGGGTGQVKDASGLIACAASCNTNASRVVTLKAKPAPGSVFSGWSGDCAGTGSCTVSMTKAHAVNASFVPVSTPKAPPPPPPPPVSKPSPLAGRIVYSTVKGSGRTRRLFVRLRVSEKVTAQLRFLQAGSQRARTTATLRPGGNTIIVALPPDAKKGISTIQVTLKDAAGHTETYTATTPVPA